MKSKSFIYILTIFLSIYSLSYAQTSIPKGNAQLIEFSNDNAKFKVPEGKTWIIYSVFSDYLADGKLKLNEYTKKNELADALEIRIFIKELNGIEKTNYLKNIYGTQLFRSTNTTTAIQYPIILPENTSFNLIILKGEMGNLITHSGTAYISLLEVNN
jgi:hypothetical protein